MSKVPPKIGRRLLSTQTARAKSKRRILGTTYDGFVDDQRTSEDDGSEEAERQERIAQQMARDEGGHPRSQRNREESVLEAKEFAEAENPKDAQAQKGPQKGLKNDKQTAPKPVLARTQGGQEAERSKKPVTDGLQALEKLKASAAKLEKGASIAPTNVAPKGTPQSALTFLHNAKEPGSFFQEVGEDELGLDPDDQGQSGQSDQDGAEGEAAPAQNSSPRAALEELSENLKDVSGVGKVAFAKTDESQVVLLVGAVKGFTHASLRAVPEQVQDFTTVIAIPYDLLPLKRDLPPAA